MDARRLSGKIVLVTGGASGIGRATARRFAEHGASVIIADRDLAGARAATHDAPGIEAIELDVTDELRWSAVIDEILERFGRLDGVVNGAGIAILGDIETCTTEDWRKVMAVNADGVFFGCRNAVRAMKAHGGSIVNLSSISGLIGGHNTAVYNASKGAVRLLTKSVALHCARQRYGIRCNSVHPTFVDTPMVDAMLQTTPDPERARERLTATIPLGRFGLPDEIADLLVYLVSDESKFVTGAEFVIDGGYTAQ